MEKLPRKLWEHPNPESTPMWKFMQDINARSNKDLKTFRQLYEFSILQRNEFWSNAFAYFALIHEGRCEKPVDEDAPITSLPLWFNGIKLNFAENMLYSQRHGTTSGRSSINKEDSKECYTEVREGYTETRHETWASLRAAVTRLAEGMRKRGVRKGDRVAAVMSNSGSTLEVFLATAALGAVFTSTSTEMGVQGILQRLKQIKPIYVFMDDGALYNGKELEIRPKMMAIVDSMKDIPEFKGLVSVPRFRESYDVSGHSHIQTINDYLQTGSAKKANVDFDFERVGFNDPLLIVYSSGTTGVPKCIVHSVGGVLLSNIKEGMLHRSMTSQSISLVYTTTSWIMYVASCTNLVFGSRIILYDGSPLVPSPSVLVEIAAKERVTHLGISPRYLLELQRKSYRPREQLDLSALEVVSCTGMVLSTALFEWFYDEGFPKNVHLANFSGGTDICGSFACDNPLEPVYAGGCQGPVLGTPISVYDPTIEGEDVQGRPVPDGIAGELVATASFPNVPLGFYGDKGGRLFASSYFLRFRECWTHGDFVVQHPVTKHIVFLGRSDGVLNPSGVRFGSADIYGVLEGAFPEIQDSICVGQRRPQDSDETLLLFLLMKPGTRLTQALIEKVKIEISNQLSKRHVPVHIFAVPEIPTTVTGKKVELPVKRIVSGEIVEPSATIVNPHCLQYFYQFVDIENVSQPKSKL